MTVADRYHDNLTNPLPPGTGCHGWILSTANYGTFAGLSGDQMFTDIRSAIPEGKRRISDREITDAIRKAVQDHHGGTFIPRPRPAPVVKHGKAALQRIIEQGKIADEADLWEASPIKIDWPPEEDVHHAL